MPYWPSCRASRISRAAWARVRTGTGPSLAAMPPNSARVTSTVCAPKSAARMAASTPAGPAPITMTSITSGFPTINDTPSADAVQCRKVSKGLDAGEKKVGAASDRGEGRQTDNLLADRTFGDFEFQRPVLVTDD